MINDLFIKQVPGEVVSHEEYVSYLKPYEPEISSEEGDENEDFIVGVEGSGINKNIEFFKDEPFKTLNKPAYLMIFLISEAMKEINDGEYGVNSEKFKPNDKQKEILKFVDKFKEYVEHYRTYTINELKLKLNSLVVDFLNKLDKETSQEIHKTILKKIFDKRDKQLPKQEDYKKYYGQILPTITEEEALKLMDKIIKPVKSIIDTIKQSNALRLNILDRPKKEIKKPGLTAIKNNSMQPGLKTVNNMKAESILNPLTLEKYDNEFDVSKYDYPEIEKRQIEEFKDLIKRYKELINRFYNSQAEGDKLRAQAELDARKKEIINKEYELNKLFNYGKFFDEFKEKFEKFEEMERLFNEVKELFKNGLYNDKELLESYYKIQEIKEFKDQYKKAFETFEKLTTAEQTHIKNKYNIFDEKNEINDFNLDELEKDLIKNNIILYLPMFKFMITKEFNEKDIGRLTQIQGGLTPKEYLLKLKEMLNIKNDKFIDMDLETLYNGNMPQEIRELIEKSNADAQLRADIKTFRDIISLIDKVYLSYDTSEQLEQQKAQLQAEHKAQDEQTRYIYESPEYKQIDSYIDYFKTFNIDEHQWPAAYIDEIKKYIREKYDLKADGKKPLIISDPTLKKYHSFINDKQTRSKAYIERLLGILEEIKQQIINEKAEEFNQRRANVLDNGKGKFEGKGKGKRKNRGCKGGADIKNLNPSFNPPSKSIKDTIENVKERERIRNIRISNFNRAKIQNTINNNSSSLFQSLNEMKPELLENLVGNGNFLTHNINKQITYIKRKLNGEKEVDTGLRKE